MDKIESKLMNALYYLGHKLTKTPISVPLDSDVYEYIEECRKDIMLEVERLRKAHVEALAAEAEAVDTVSFTKETINQLAYQLNILYETHTLIKNLGDSFE